MIICVIDHKTSLWLYWFQPLSNELLTSVVHHCGGFPPIGAAQ